MKTPSGFRALLWALAALALALGLDPVSARQKRPSRRPAPAVTLKRADGAVLAGAVPALPDSQGTVPLARNPGPALPPGSPIADRTTIAPFAIPGDTSGEASERAKVMNVPRAGLIMTGPLPKGFHLELVPRTGAHLLVRDSSLVRPRSH